MRPAPPANALPPRLARLSRSYLDKARPRIRKGLFRCFDNCHARYVRLHTRANAEHALTHARSRILDALLEAERHTKTTGMPDVAIARAAVMALAREAVMRRR